jgi:hypothetical protein
MPVGASGRYAGVLSFGGAIEPLPIRDVWDFFGIQESRKLAMNPAPCTLGDGKHANASRALAARSRPV